MYARACACLCVPHTDALDVKYWYLIAISLLYENSFIGNWNRVKIIRLAT